jgi:hypothetical protein
VSKPERKRKNLIRLGIEQGQAYAWSRSRIGGWAIAQSPILVTTITLDRLKMRGYISLLEIYQKISPQLNEPLYMCLSLSEREERSSRTYSGVRGSPLGYSIIASYSIIVLYNSLIKSSFFI